MSLSFGRKNRARQSYAARGFRISATIALIVAPGCAKGVPDPTEETDTEGQSAGGTFAGSTGGEAQASSGGFSSHEGVGGAPLEPIDCSGLSTAGFELCTTTDDTCGAVFVDGSGCAAVCGSAGLVCKRSLENIDASCAPDLNLPGLPCETGHQSDYCVCVRPGPGVGTGGSSSGGGRTGGTGGVDAAEDDCNALTHHPIIEVRKDGTGDFPAVQAAIDSISGQNTTQTVLRIAPGTYYEKLNINASHVTLCGQVGQTENTVLTYSDGADTPNGNGGTVGTSGSASVNLSASDVSVENITFQNTRGVGSQAVALLVSGERVQFKNSRFLGHQDTLYVKEGSQYFLDCYIEGTVDFVFGGATAVFDGCTVHNVGGGSAVTAPSTDESSPFGIVFLDGELTAAASVASGSVNLGRNWRPYGATVYLRTQLGSHISSIGWIKMGDNVLSTARFAEYQTSGPGAQPAARAPESKQLTAAEAAIYTIDNIFGQWRPSYAL